MLERKKIKTKFLNYKLFETVKNKLTITLYSKYNLHTFMFKKLFISLILLISFISCKKEELKKERYPYLIEANQVGKLKKGAKVSDLDSIFSLDSIVTRIGEGDYMFTDKDRYLIYDTLGKHLLTLTPSEQHDMNEEIKNIQIFDNRFRTEKKLNIQSTFNDIKKNYSISKIENTLNNIRVFVNEINGKFIIDKKELPEKIRYNMNIEIDSIFIPDNAHVKHFMIDWE